MNKTITESFKFWLPISKASDSPDGKSRIIEGIASTPDLDLQNERVSQGGINFDYFLKHGYFNWDHKPGAENKIGEPWECRITPKGLYVKGVIYKDKQVADNVWEHITALASDPHSKRKVGFSLQGKTVKRNGNSIAKCWIQDVAITTAPINYNTYLDIVKSLSEQGWDSEDISEESIEKTLSTSSASELIPESLDSDAKDQLYKEDDEDDGKRRKKRKRNKRYTKKSLASLISDTLGYSRGTSNLVTDVLFDLSAE